MEKSNAYLITILIIMTSLSPLSQGLTIAGYTINQVVIDDVVLAEVVTNTEGAFRIVLNVLQTVLLSSSTCGLGVNVPEGYCALVAPENVLYAPLMLLNIVRNNSITTAYYTANLIFG
ncbi:hypothetical protein N665_0272s0020 [Sinapis alba]|nr:hypothetical protein N665_0272s0020 [Sinapis alba]